MPMNENNSIVVQETLLIFPGPPKCQRKTSGSQIPKRARQKGTSTLSGTWDGADLRKKSADLRQMSGSQIPKRIRQKVPKAKGKCPDLKCMYVRGLECQ